MTYVRPDSFILDMNWFLDGCGFDIDVFPIRSVFV